MHCNILVATFLLILLTNFSLAFPAWGNHCGKDYGRPGVPSIDLWDEFCRQHDRCLEGSTAELWCHTKVVGQMGFLTAVSGAFRVRPRPLFPIIRGVIRDNFGGKKWFDKETVASPSRPTHLMTSSDINGIVTCGHIIALNVAPLLCCMISRDMHCMAAGSVACPCLLWLSCCTLFRPTRPLYFITSLCCSSNLFRVPLTIE